MWDLPDGFTPGAGISGDFGRNFTRCKTCQTGLHQVEGFPEKKNFSPESSGLENVPSPGETQERNRTDRISPGVILGKDRFPVPKNLRGGHAILGTPGCAHGKHRGNSRGIAGATPGSHPVERWKRHPSGPPGVDLVGRPHTWCSLDGPSGAGNPPPPRDFTRGSLSLPRVHTWSSPVCTPGVHPVFPWAKARC